MGSVQAGDVRAAVVFDFAVLSSPGGRDDNEDSTGVFVSPETQGAEAQQGCWVLADGLGGHKGGECASKLAVAGALESYRSDSRLNRQALATHVARANEAVLERQQSEPELRSMRTTIVALIASGEAAMWAHAGDSRLYHFRRGEIAAQTRDHSVPQRLADAGEIAAEQIRFHEDRNRLLRSLGSKADAGATVLSEPVAIEPDDAFLLASDGLWEWVTEAEMLEDLGRALDAESWLGAMEARLKSRADSGNDNYSGIAVMVRGNSGARNTPQ
jgi:serine/threonine protein phosphatase PrpC